MPQDTRRERGNSSEREALRSRSRPPRSSQSSRRSRDRSRDRANDSETDRERRERRRERQKKRDGTREPGERGTERRKEREGDRTGKSRDRERDRQRGERDRHKDRERKDGERNGDGARSKTKERTEHDRERTSHRAERDGERIRSTSRPIAAVALDTDSDSAPGSDAPTSSRRYRRSEVLAPPKRRRDPPPEPSVGSSEGSNRLSAAALQALNRASGTLKGKKDRQRQASQPLMQDGVSRGVSLGATGVKRRVVSGVYMEEGNATELLRGGASEEYEKFIEKRAYYEGIRVAKTRSCMDWWTKKRMIIVGVISILLIILIIVVAMVASKKKSSGSGSGSGSTSTSSTKDCGSVPTAVKNTDMDPCSWYDTTDFNLTYTNDTVGDLPIMGLFSDWDDSAQANDKVPALNKDWGNYTERPARGVNLGGWLSLEPFIAPSMFSYSSANQIIDEYTLCTKLGGTAKSTIEKHYAEFITEDDFKQIAAAGLDHVRIPYSYWAVQTYDADPYVFRTSWRYLLRGIEWARKYGLRVNLDLHALPGSQNGWNHSGRQGPINWLNGTNGNVNAERSLDVHDRLSKFFAQDRYKNIIAFYGLVNEPKMTALVASEVISWTEKAYNLVRGNGITGAVVFGDGFMGLDKWQGVLTGHSGTLVLDVHQYVIFNTNQIVYTHAEKVSYACSGWTNQTQQSMDTTTGFGPTMFAEWSQADTDCAQYLTNVGWGNRWTGTYKTGTAADSVLTPRCPAEDDTCDCKQANADASQWSDAYKQFLKDFAEAQMYSFEKGWGWWYWTWKTESAPQWSYQAGLAAGVLPEKAYGRDFDCSSIPSGYDGLAETY